MSLEAPSLCTGFTSDSISVEALTAAEWRLWYRRGSGDPHLEQQQLRIVPRFRFLTDPGQVLLRVDGTSWDRYIINWRYLFLEGYEQFSFLRICNFPTLQVVKCASGRGFFMRSKWMLLTSFECTFEEIEALDKALETAADSWEKFNTDEATIHNHGYTVPEAPQVVMRLATTLPTTHLMRVYPTCS